MGLRKGKFDYASTTSFGNRRPRANRAKKKKEETHVVTAVPTWPSSPQIPHNPMHPYPPHQYHYSANIGPPPCPTPLKLRAPNQPQRPPQHHPQNPFPIQPRPNATPNPKTNTNPRRNFPERKPVEFTPIPMSYADLLPSLLNNQMAVVSLGRVYQPPFPNGTILTLHICAYYGGILGHSIEQCVAFKHKM